MKQDEIENKKKAFLGEKIIYDNLGQYIWAVQKNGHLQKLADLRGWGAIQNLFTDIKDAEKFQDELGELIAKTLHDHLLSKKPGVSDEEIKEIAKAKADKHSFIDPSDAKFYREVFEEAFEYFKSLSPQVVQSEVSGDWVEDFSHENGNYLNTCIKCDNEFKGHKRRVVCKTCATLTPPDAEKWISVEEKPKEDIHCLVFLYNPNTNDSWQETAYTLEGYFHGVMGKQEYITHWMQLPKPPINKQGGK